MTLATILSSHATTFALVATRFAGFVVASPFPGSYATTTSRVGLVVVLTTAVTLASSAPPVPLDAHILVAAPSELLVGTLIGLVFRFLFVAADMIGFALSQATGLNTPSLLNPATDAQDTAPSRIVDLIAMLVALALGAHRVVLAGALESFRIVPPGADMNLAAGAHTIISVATNSIGVGLRLSMPLVAVALITHVGLAMVARAAPSLQIFNAGLTVLVAVGLVAFISDEANLVRGLGVHFSSAGPEIERVLRAVKSS